jgi:LysM repeat protein
MRTSPAALALLLLAAATAPAQEGGARPPPRDTLRLGEPLRVDSIRMADGAEEDPAGAPPERPRPAPPPPSAGPFGVHSSGDLPPRPPRGEVVYAVERPAGRTLPRDTAGDAPAPVQPGPAAAPAPPAAQATPPARTSPAGGSPADARTHVVEAGDTFYGIARRYGVTAAQLRAVNPDVDPDVLAVGDRLALPAAARDSRQGGAGGPAAGSPPSRPPPGTRTHVVEAGETLFGIARRHGVTVADLRRLNALETDQVRVGQRLLVPPPG